MPIPLKTYDVVKMGDTMYMVKSIYVDGDELVADVLPIQAAEKTVRVNRLKLVNERESEMRTKAIGIDLTTVNGFKSVVLPITATSFDVKEVQNYLLGIANECQRFAVHLRNNGDYRNAENVLSRLKEILSIDVPIWCRTMNARYPGFSEFLNTEDYRTLRSNAGLDIDQTDALTLCSEVAQLFTTLGTTVSVGA